MTPHRLTVPVFALLVGLGGIVAAAPAFAQAASPGPTAPPPAAAAQAPAPGAQDHGLSLSRRTDGRIAYMKAALRITPQQEPRWNKVAQALRENAHEADAARASFRAQRGQPQSAVEALQARGRFVALKAKQNDRLLAAFEPLYRSLSPEQKQAADQLLVPHHHHHHHHMI